jgi:hypothetical protein
MVMTRLATGEFGSSDTNYQNIPISMLAVGAALPPNPVSVSPYRGFAYTILDESIFSCPIPKDWQPGSDLSLYIRWACNEAYALASAKVRWNGYYMTVANDMSQVVGAGTTANTNSADINIPTLARQLREDLLVTAVAANLAVGDTIGFKITRVALAGAGANPTAEPEIYAAYLSYTRFISST